jgi:cation diffusion facilitator CzcD-associated flavoprotein CzcO
VNANAYDADITIVGGGPIGLAFAQALQRHRRRAVILEAEEIGHTWASAYPHLRLHTRKGAAALPGLAYPRDTPTFPSARAVHAYLQGYAAHFGLSVRAGVRVTAVARSPGGWQLSTSAGPWGTRWLVWAAGIWANPQRPQVPGQATFPGPMLHVRDYRGPEPFRGQRLLVVGAGNSGKDVATAAVGVAREVVVAVRGPVMSVGYPNAVSQWSGALWRRLPPALLDRLLPRFRTPRVAPGVAWPQTPLRHEVAVVGFELLEAIEAGRVRTRPALVGFEGERAVFADGRQQVFDAVVFATGFAPATALVECFRGDPQLWLVGERYPTLETFLQQLRREVPAAAAALVRAQRAAGG